MQEGPAKCRELALNKLKAENISKFVSKALRRKNWTITWKRDTLVMLFLLFIIIYGNYPIHNE